MRPFRATRRADAATTAARAAMRNPRQQTGACGLAVLLALTAHRAHAASIDRQFELKISLSAEQSWRNLLQYSKGTTAQEYEMSTRLRSDGIRYADNLLDLDTPHRLEIKQDYLTRQGLLRLKQENGGKLPGSAEDVKKFTDRMQERGLVCNDDGDCDTETAERFAALTALQNNSPQVLEEFLVPPVNPDGSGFFYFFGYGGCPNRLHITNTTHIAGMRAFDRDRKNLRPFALDRSADSNGSPIEQKALCQRYTITLDAKRGTMFVENTYIPSPRGTTRRTLDGNSASSDDNLPVPAEVLDWTTAKLRQTQAAGSATENLRVTTPLDGDRTVLGDFDGTLKVTLSWSFKPVAATAPK
ncbi:MAG: formylglycine-rating enzyme family protein [Nevskia sp.]|nr:formylglycine-rating enzyme family protein [Nevskia sp.]